MPTKFPKEDFQTCSGPLGDSVLGEPKSVRNSLFRISTRFWVATESSARSINIVYPPFSFVWLTGLPPVAE
jgi:hypothetical protein